MEVWRDIFSSANHRGQCQGENFTSTLLAAVLRIKQRNLLFKSKAHIFIYVYMQRGSQKGSEAQKCWLDSWRYTAFSQREEGLGFKV